MDGIFCANESSTFAVMRVLQENGWAGKVKLGGFEASSNLVKGRRDGALDGLIVQENVQMGYRAEKTMVTHLKGGQVERIIDTGVHLVTRDTMDQPEMKALLTPDLSQWLK